MSQPLDQKLALVWKAQISFSKVKFPPRIKKFTARTNLSTGRFRYLKSQFELVRTSQRNLSVKTPR